MSLRSWLRRNPQPAEIRVINEDDEEKVIKLSSDARNRWKGAEEAIYSARARSVQCLDADGAILRAMPITTDAEGNEVDDSEVLAKRYEKELKGERRELGLVLDRYGDRLNEAFERGAAAANVSQDNLVQLVQILTQNLSMAITNIHNLSLQYGQLLQQNDGDGGSSSRNDELIRTVLGGAVQRAMGGMGGGGGGNGKPNGKPNGGRAEK
jgi:hypothetical protein